MAYEQPRVPIWREDKLTDYIKELVRFLKSFSLAAWDSDRRNTERLEAVKKTAEAALPKSGTAKNSEKLGGKAPEYYLRPRNLLDNSDWRIKKNIVNQRGQDHYVGIGNRDVYTIDRWVIPWQDGLEVTVGDGYIQKGNKIWEQRLENIDPNKVYTGALALLDGTVYVHSGKLADGFGDWNNSFWCGYENNQGYFTIRNGMTQPVIWAALYEGSYTAETLPPYVPKGYAAELAECQRYCWRTYDMYRIRCNQVTSSVLDFMITFPVPMRTEPQLILNGNAYVYSMSSVAYSGWELSMPTVANAAQSGYMMLRATKSGHGLTDGWIDIPEGSIFSSDL